MVIEYNEAAFAHKGENMAKRPTDEETWTLQRMWTEDPPELLEGSGSLTRHRELLRLLDEVSANTSRGEHNP
jgi:coenzyme F420-reducing hydrogenase beta subunit